MTDPDAIPSMPPIQPEEPVATRPAPASVVRASQLMYVAAGVNILNLIVTLASKDAIRDSVLERDPNAADVDTTVNGTLVFGVVLGLVIAGLWIWLAMMVRDGKNWARIVAWALAGISVLFTVIGLFNPVSALLTTVAVISAIVSIGIAVFLAMRDSNEFFARRT